MNIYKSDSIIDAVIYKSRAANPAYSNLRGPTPPMKLFQGTPKVSALYLFQQVHFYSAVNFSVDSQLRKIYPACKSITELVNTVKLDFVPAGA